MKIGILGGAFNPPHKMHKEIALKLLENNYVDMIIYVPVGNNYNKPGLLDGNHRIKMLELMLSAYKDKIKISDFEVRGSLYTINTLNHFKEEYPKDDIYFICGTDNLNELDTWHKYTEILSFYKLLIISRDKNKFNDIIRKYSKYQENIILASNVDASKISSTIVRKEILENGFTEELKKFLDEPVIAYLKSLNLEVVWENKK